MSMLDTLMVTPLLQLQCERKRRARSHLALTMFSFGVYVTCDGKATAIARCERALLSKIKELIFYYHHIGRATMSTAAGMIRCPPYCRTNCATTHHPLLVALLNTVDTADVELMEKRLQEFREIFMRYTVVKYVLKRSDSPVCV